MPERGLLLLRVRDEIKLSIESYTTLYQSAVVFAMRKQLQAEHGKDELEQRIKDLEADNLRQTNRVIELTNKLNATKTRNKERSDGEDKQRMDEIKFLAEQ